MKNMRRSAESLANGAGKYWLYKDGAGQQFEKTEVEGKLAEGWRDKPNAKRTRRTKAQMQAARGETVAEETAEEVE